MSGSATWRGGGLVHRLALPPAEIERRSLGLLEEAIATLPLPDWDALERRVALRMAYAAGDPSIAALVSIVPGAVRAGIESILRGAPIVCDVRMAAAGVSRALTERLGCEVLVAIDRPSVVSAAQESGLPRAVHAIAELRHHLPGAIAMIGNAPTALCALLDLLDDGAGRPAIVVACPPGFVAAAEAKEELLQRDLPSIVVRGTRGGSAVAAAAVNALLMMAGEEVARHA